MTNSQQLLSTWTNLRKKLISTLTELKINHKDNWALVKSKSAIQQIKILPYYELEGLKNSLREKQSLLQAMDQRPRGQLLSSQDQTKYNQLKEEIDGIQKKLEWQETLTKGYWSQLAKDHFDSQEREYNLRLRKKSLSFKKRLAQSNEKHDKLNDKLNHLRTLVRAGDINQLQVLVRKGKI